MIVSGEYIRSISRQPEQSRLDVSFDLSPFDIISVGLSGSSYLNTLISGGLIYDSQNRNIYGGQSGDRINISIEQSNNLAKFYINNKLLSYATGSYSYFNYFYCSSSLSKDFNVLISGVQPILDYSGLNQFSDSGRVLTGAIINTTPTRRFRILSGDIVDNISDAFLSGWQTGDIVDSGLVYLGYSGVDMFRATGDITLGLYTNFGLVNVPLNLESNSTNNNSFFTISPSGAVYFDQHNTYTYTVDSYFNFGARNLGASLKYVSGGASAAEIVTYTGLGTGYLYGLISGTGLATGLISGYLGNGSYYYTGIDEYNVITGNFTGTFYTTGTGVFSGVTYTGLMPSGYNLTLSSGDSGIWAGGQGTGNISGNYRYFSGSGGYESPTVLNTSSYTGYYNRQVVSGQQDYLNLYINLSQALTPSDVFTFFYGVYDYFQFTSGANLSGVSGSNYIYTGGFSTIETQVSGQFNFSAISFIFTGLLNDVGIKYPIYNSSGFSLLSTGIFDAYTFTGLIDKNITSGLSSGVLESTGQINFENIWGFRTGRNLNYMIDYNYYNYYNSTGYINSGSNAILTRNAINNNIIEVSYDGTATSGINIAQLNVTDGTNSISLLLSGTGIQ